MSIPDFVKIVEVGPRDGLQNETFQLTTTQKITLIDLLSQTGLTTIEAGSFVSPKWVPQMASSSEVFQGINRHKNVSYTCLTPNIRGYEAAKAAQASEIAIFGAASESFSQKNINCSITESLERFEPIMQEARKDGIAVRGYVSCVMGCPYEGEISPEKVRDVAEKMVSMGCYEISLGDTIGRGTALETRRLIEVVSKSVPVDKIAGHFHDTYGQALSNIFAALDMGVAVFDASIAGLGGCPYAKGASGNVATEDVVYMLNGSGVSTHINLQNLLKASDYISDILGRPAISKVAVAMPRSIV